MDTRRLERMVQRTAGSLKEVLGKIVGNKRVAFEGRAQKQHAKARAAAAKARTRGERAK